MDNSSEPAFPVADTIHPVTGERCEPLTLGLTKREYFAGLAMQGYLAAHAGIEGLPMYPKRIAEMSVDYADELLKQLEAK